MHRRAFLVASGTAALAGCSGGTVPGNGTPGPDTGPPTTSPRTGTAPAGVSPTVGSRPAAPHKGVSLSPRSFESPAFEAFIEQAAGAGTALRWAGDWAQLADPQAAPAVVAEVAGQHGLATVIDTGVYSVSQGALFRPLTPGTRQTYVDSAAAFAAKHGPDYLGLGVEVNLHAAADPGSFETFVDLFAETRAAVAEVAPATRVHVTFQYEQLQGLRAGLFGGENDRETARWELLDRFPDADVVGLTAYPGLVYPDPADVPDGYFDPIAERTDRPLAVTETGWTAETIAEGWESDEVEQAAYVRRLFELVGSIDLVLLLWLWLYGQEASEPAFRGMGLRRDDGSARPAWDAWVAGEL